MGLLDKAIKMSEDVKSQGELEIAESIEHERKLNDKKSEEGEEKEGLLQRAELFKSNLVEKDIYSTTEDGLLKKAENILKQEEPEYLAKFEETKASGLLEKAQSFVGKTIAEEQEQRYEEKTTELEAAIEPTEEEIIPEVTGVAGPVKEYEEKEAFETGEKFPEIEEEVPEEGTAIERDYPALLEKSLLSGDINGEVKIMDSVLSEEGFYKLGEVILEFLISISGGKFGIIFILKNEVFTPTIFVPRLERDERKKYKILKAKLKKNEKIASSFMELDSPILSKDKMVAPIYESMKAINELEPWLLLPFISHNVIYGFAVISRINEKKKLNRKMINSLMMIFKEKVALEVVENRIVENESKLISLEENYKALDTIRKDMLETKTNIEEAFNNFCSSVSIDIASLILNPKDKAEILVTKGLSQESKVKYNVSRVKSIINRSIKAKKATLIKDTKPNLFGLVGEDIKKSNILVIVPIFYMGKAYGTLIVHKFSTKITKLSSELTSKLTYSSEYLLPLLMNYKLSMITPFDLINMKIEEELKWSNKTKKKLIFVSLRIDNIYEIIRKVGFKKYINLYNKFRGIIQNMGDGFFKSLYISPDRIVLILRESAIDVDDFKINLKEGLKSVLKRQKLFQTLVPQIESLIYPEQLKDLGDILNLISSK